MLNGADYLEWLREDIIAAVLSLPSAEQREMRVPSGWSPLELFNQALHMEQRWFVWGFLGEPVAEPWGDWNVPEPWTSDDSDETRPSARWQVADDVTAEALATRLHALGERTRAVLLEYGLDTPGAVGGRFGEDPPMLEWMLSRAGRVCAARGSSRRQQGNLERLSPSGSGNPVSASGTRATPITKPLGWAVVSCPYRSGSWTCRQSPILSPWKAPTCVLPRADPCVISTDGPQVWRSDLDGARLGAVEPMGVTMSVYKVIEIVGTSSSSWEDAAVQAVNTAKETLRDLRVAQVVEQDLDLAGDELVFRTKLSISFKYQAD